ncbi:MAG: hypothetical protein FJ271_06830 [Planctomycetes bacterium]|nr:hypothetical protein [Planctomycetota bacterium]
MDEHRAALEKVVALPALLGYLNFSEGRADARFQKQLSDAMSALHERGLFEPWKALRDLLQAELVVLREGQSSAFRDTEQVEGVLRLVFEGVLPAYRRHHADLLFHQSDNDLMQPFFLARVFEAVLGQRGPWHEDERIIVGALRRLNDYVGHRPIATLESRPLGEPYEHERLRPIPLFIKGAGAAWGRYQRLVEKALEILGDTDQNLLHEACFSVEQLDELALDPRGYDFGHPADKRPNYVFGEWDPHLIDNQGRYRRYVARQFILDGLLERAGEGRGEIDADEAFIESASVLAGTILMATGVSGSGPETHDSSVTLSSLVPRIAKYREEFYNGLIKRLPETHAARLRQEAKLTRQPFGAARQYMNNYLAKQRAFQLQQKQLALLLAEMGYPDVSRRQARTISVASIRLLAEMHLRLALGRLHVERGAFAEAAALLPEVEEHLRRGIECGAVVDPWNILGFQGQYLRFAALEDSVHDHRIDELLAVMSQLFSLYFQVLSNGAAKGNFKGEAHCLEQMKRLADWWDRFATHEVSGVPRVHGGEATTSAEHVARALGRWRERGAASSDLAFWREHLESFTSPKSFALVVDALLHKEDYRAAMALLVTWVGQAATVSLEEADHSFHSLALRWMLGVCGPPDQATASDAADAGAGLEMVAKFLDYLEANAEDFWHVPRPETFDVGAIGPDDSGRQQEQEEDNPYEAAYEDVTYEDSTDDDVEAEVLDFMPQKDFDLTAIGEELETRLRFLATVARLWNLATRTARHLAGPAAVLPAGLAIDKVQEWRDRAKINQQQLLLLLDKIHEHEVPKPSGSYESVVEFDRRRLLKERLLTVIIGACMDTTLAIGAMQAILGEASAATEQRPAWEPAILELEQALTKGDGARARAALPAFIEAFRSEPLLYTPLAAGGHPRQILQASLAQIILRGLVMNLPRIGLIRETYELVRSAQQMEESQQLQGPRITEFDHLFQAACRATVEAFLDSVLTDGAVASKKKKKDRDKSDAENIATLLETVTEPFLALWIQHSKTLRLSVLEQVNSAEAWDRLRSFIRKYGHDLFQPRFLALGNLRGILHQGVKQYLNYLRENPDPLHTLKLMDDLEQHRIAQEDAENSLDIILQALVENYEEYRDFNATTTQSDFGENLHQLLDFLRLKLSYERNAWQLRPLILVHEVLARRQRRAADLWREQVQGLTRELADEHIGELRRLEKEHGMVLRTLADRLKERFTKPLLIDRLVSGVEPAMDEARKGATQTPLEGELQPFIDNPVGAGLDVPVWLRRLVMEVQRVRTARTDLVRLVESFYPIPKIIVSTEELRAQFRDWDK